jgi:hypothetical protein
MFEGCLSYQYLSQREAFNGQVSIRSQGGAGVLDERLGPLQKVQLRSRANHCGEDVRTASNLL